MAFIALVLSLFAILLVVTVYKILSIITIVKFKSSVREIVDEYEKQMR